MHCQKSVLDVEASAVVHYHHLFGLDVNNLAFSCYLHQKFFNQHLFRAGQASIPILRQAWNVAIRYISIVNVVCPCRV